MTTELSRKQKHIHLVFQFPKNKTNGISMYFILTLYLVEGGGGTYAFHHLIGLITHKTTHRKTCLWSLYSCWFVTIKLQKLALYVPRFISDGPSKSEVSRFKIAKSRNQLIFKLGIHICFGSRTKGSS